MAELTNGPIAADTLAAAAAAGAASAAGVAVEIVETRSIGDLTGASGLIVAVADGGAGRVAVAVPPEVEAAEAVATGAAGAVLGAVGGGAQGAVRVVADIAGLGFGPQVSVSEIKALVAGTESVMYLAIEVADAAPSVSSAAFPEMGNGRSAMAGGMRDVSVLSDVSMTVTVELGRTSLKVRDLLGLTSGSVVELDQRAGAPVDILVNGTAVARGDVVVVDEELGVRITDVLGGV